MPNIEIDGQKLQAADGSMVIEAADAAGIYIPRFCYHKKLSVAANCRMCLVDVEKVGKPAPACATPVTEGMRIFTRSQKTRDAQRGVMEFLLINHPLDCPICDQGGECDLQDLAVGYGKDISRFAENKRIVKDKNLGPLIATDMTRCIHCTRCVRFGQEIAGMMELGATGRGEHMQIGTYVESAVSSELSGNMIDLCPVGALTSKPFRYTARPWELIDRPSISPHDCVGTNLTVQVRRGQVMRVLPRENEDINEVWLSDRDRFSYTALNSEDRLTAPMIREHGAWREVDWHTALEFAAANLRKIKDSHGADQIGALAVPTATVEEFFLLQKLMRGLGSHNVDHRLRGQDFSDDERAPLAPGLGQRIRDLQDLDAALLIGSNIRKEQPLLAHRLRQAFLDGARIMAVNPIDYELSFELAAKHIAAPAHMLQALAQIAKDLAARAGKSLPDAVKNIAQGQGSVAAQAIAAQLSAEGNKAVLLGEFAMTAPDSAPLRAVAEFIAELSGAKLGYLPRANSVGAWLAGCVPHRGANNGPVSAGGLNAQAMIAAPRKAYLLLNVEPELDCADGRAARTAMEQADFVVALSSFKDAAEYAQVMLPVAPFSETSGTFVNCEGVWQSFEGAVLPLKQARPAWKVLRVLANLLSLPGFDYTDSREVLAEVKQDPLAPPRAKHWQLNAAAKGSAAGDSAATASQLLRLSEVPIYAGDNLVRRAPPLQATPDSVKPSARMNAAQAAKLGLDAAPSVRVAGAGEAVLDMAIDPRVPDGCVLIAAGYRETAMLGGDGPVRVIKA